jgi:5-enolpyruvylshikimate-3-phosphate synthase
MQASDVAQVRALLADSLDVWRVHGIVADAEAPAIALIRGEDGTLVRVEIAAAADAPIRWWVRWRTHDAMAMRSRPCTSIVMLLRTVRAALGADAGRKLRIAPGAGEP